MIRAEHLATLVMFASLGGVSAARAETRGTLRVGLMPLELESSSDTPLFGDDVDRAVAGYNAAAAAFDRQNGGRTARIDAGDLGVAETLFLIAPGVEFGGGPYFFRLEALIGLGADLRSVGAGVYPLNLQAPIGRTAAVYISAGGTASWLDRSGSGDVGGLLSLRGAAGVRFARRFVVEVGYSAFVLGGTVNSSQLDAMMTSRELVLPARPEDAISAGEARGLVDVSAGITF